MAVSYTHLEKVSFIVPVRNRNRTIGAMLSGAVPSRYGHDGLPDDTIHIQCNGTAGQSFGAFLAHGITMDQMCIRDRCIRVSRP